MKNHHLLTLITNLNHGKSIHPSDVIHKHQIAPNVEYTRFWSHRRPSGIQPQTCFLIKRDKQYVGAVILGIDNLSCCLLPEFRGYLFLALRNTILPFLFLHEDHEQLKISLKEDDYTKTHLSISKNLLLLLNFKETNKDEFQLSIEDFDFSAINLDPQHPGMTLQQFEATKQELASIAKRLLQLNAHLESAYGKDPNDDPLPFLEKISHEVRTHQNKLVQRAINFHKNEADIIELEYMS